MQLFIKEHIIKIKQACLLHGAGVNLEQYYYQEYPTDTKETHFLFIGRVMKEKGIDELFKAVRKLRRDGINCSLDVLGGCEENYENIIKCYEKEGWLRYHGYQEDVRPFIAKCHCFVLPSWHEGMANTNLESAATGRPIITSDIAGCKEAVINGKSGFLCKVKDSKDLYITMRKFLNLSYDEKKEMGLAGRRHMESVFDKKEVVRKTINKLYGE